MMHAKHTLVLEQSKSEKRNLERAPLYGAWWSFPLQSAHIMPATSNARYRLPAPSRRLAASLLTMSVMAFVCGEASAHTPSASERDERRRDRKEQRREAWTPDALKAFLKGEPSAKEKSKTREIPGKWRLNKIVLDGGAGNWPAQSCLADARHTTIHGGTIAAQCCVPANGA